jgi:hypothetical protein
MNLIDGATYGLTVQFGRIDPNDSQWNTSESPQTQGPDSFLSILNLLDVNADKKIDSDELKFGAGFAINSMIQSKDTNFDQLLSPEEAGVSSDVVAQLDTDSDQMLGAKEMITSADKIIDGLVSFLDTDGDKALSPQELAIFELLFTGNSSLGAMNAGKSEAPQEVSEETPASPEVAAVQPETSANQTTTSTPMSPRNPSV